MRARPTTGARRRDDGASTSTRGDGAPGSILLPGRNCWRVEWSLRTRLLRDAADYFALARSAILHAEHSVFLLGWDILAGLDLLAGEAPDDGAPARLAELLDFVVRRRRHLHCHVLVWDHSTLYALERDPFTRIRFGWLTHHRVHFRFDDHHPLAASHHDKVLVVDDRLAFAGSIDLTTHRWDTSAHAVVEPRRVNALGKPYAPYHDVQLMVEGDAARALGELARARWHRLGVRRLPRLATPPAAPLAWLPPAPGDLHGALVGIARTEPAFHGAAEHRECEALFLDAIAAARSWIYIENQYFTDPRIAAALARRLAEPRGPEVVVVGPRECEGWLERRSMGVLRDAVLGTLVASDVHKRLRVLHPMASRAADVATFIHSKVMAVDGVLFRVGSANLARRSMGMDSECDLAIAAGEGDGATREGIETMVCELLAEHLGVTMALVHERWRSLRSLGAAIAALSGGDRTLVPTPCATGAPPASESMRDLFDPGEPMGFSSKLASALPELAAEQDRGRRVARSLPLLVVGVAAMASWRSGAGEPRSFSDVVAWLAAAPHSAGTVLAAFAVLVVAGLTFLPLQLLTLLTAVVIGPWLGGGAALAGALVAAAIGYRVGATMAPQRLARWIGTRVYRLLRMLHRPGTPSIVTLRLIPVVSATTMNLLAGAARVPARAFWTGTGLGLLPPIASASVVGGLMRRALLLREPWTGIAAGLLAMLLIITTLRMRRVLLQQHADRSLQGHGEHSGFG